MSKPERGYRTEIFSDRTRYVKTIPEKPYWENDFRDATTLLEPVLTGFLKEIRHGRHGFSFHFRLQDQEYKKGKTILTNNAAD